MPCNDTNNVRVISLKVADDAWHQYALTYDGQTVKFYVDGALEEETALGGECT